MDINDILQLLIYQADAYRKYIATKDESNIYIYENNRTKVIEKSIKFEEWLLEE